MKLEIETKKERTTVTFDRKTRAWAGYDVATTDSPPPARFLRAGAQLPDGRHVEFFLNRETGLIVVDIIAKDKKSGMELLRYDIVQGVRYQIRQGER